MTTVQKLQVKADNEALIKQQGYRINDWLPIPNGSAQRKIQEIKGRMGVMTALLNIAFGAPTHIIRKWIDANGLGSHLSNSESALLSKKNSELTDSEVNSLEWYLEALWSFMWLTGVIESLNPTEYVGDNMASLLPSLKNGESNEKLERLEAARPVSTAYKMLDYYYRLHWFCVDERLKGGEAKLNEGVVYQRRKSLEWACDPTADWDEVEMGT
ncbi:DUF4272 domain-containing protein [Hymenobacter sp. BRD67]|uniref:DUF4272 domain-containing protein n=1 Tax=Hymenobacter sp. BRD67 TaxID=2675877 RepID=UPI001564FA84|nr:DUF4272 domain-containing protein [Hymenobacter sp. BRD67]QKG52883.1 DUF4272 domain-containing protein [Hymenobacter sp. BRD67]